MSPRLLGIIALTVGLLGCGEAEESSGIVAASNCSARAAGDVFEVEPGLTATVKSTGYGRAAAANDYADVHTTLWLYDEAADGGRGQEIWTSGGDQPFQFQIGREQVISGWDKGVPCMLIGETRELIIASELAYGAAGKPPVPPNATLLFNIELVKLTVSE